MELKKVGGIFAIFYGFSVILLMFISIKLSIFTELDLFMVYMFAFDILCAFISIPAGFIFLMGSRADLIIIP